MKTTYYKFFFVLIVLLFSGSYGILAQQEMKGIKQRLDIELDELGDANIALTMTLNASQWNNFKQTVGNNQSYLKRLMVRGMPKYYLTDFKYEEESMDRSYTFHMKGLAAATVDKSGKWRAELDMKNPDISKVNDHEFRLNLNMMTDAGFVEQVQYIKIPRKAKEAKVEKDSFGNAYLSYKLKEKSMQTTASIFGALLLISGAGLFYIGNRKTK